MLGSALSISCPNTILNTIVAEELCQFADELEGKKDLPGALSELIKRVYHEHKRIVFNGNNYSEEWAQEAKKRGLEEYKTTADALPVYIRQKNIDLFVKHKIYTEKELISRYEILIENYSKVVLIEALTMLDMAKKEIFPAVCRFSTLLSDSITAQKSACPHLHCTLQEGLLEKVSTLLEKLITQTQKLDDTTVKLKKITDLQQSAYFCKDEVLPAMTDLRAVADELETIVDKQLWPFPTYSDLMFGI